MGGVATFCSCISHLLEVSHDDVWNRAACDRQECSVSVCLIVDGFVMFFNVNPRESVTSAPMLPRVGTADRGRGTVTADGLLSFQ